MGGVLTDAELVSRALTGSDAAFAGLVSRHQAAVRAFMRRMLASGWAEADDLAQEAFLAAWRSLRSRKEPTGFRTWPLGSARPKAQERIPSPRRPAARGHVWLEASEAPAGISAEDRLAMAQAMAELAPDVRACVALCLAEGLSHPEAAVALGLPLGTVKSHVTRGRARLLKALGGSDDA